jgi:pyruvate dehydrogenase E2 component (dihydrolipoamide acetyltransferase)
VADIIEMIQLSPTMEEGVLVEWLKKEGDAVEEGEVIAEIETDKATMEMESFYDGTVLKLLVAVGDAAAVGTALAIVGEPGEDISALLASATGGGSAAPAAPEPAAAAPAPAPAAPAAAPATAPAPAPTVDDGQRVRSSPLARKIAAERGIDVRLVTGTGPAGRIVKRDVEAFVAPAAAAQPAAAPAAAAPVAVPVVASGLEGETVRLSQMRKAIAKNLSVAWQAPAFMLTREIAMDAAMAFRKQLNAALAADDAGKVSVNDLIIKACGKALIDVPEMNAAFQGDELLLYKTADIGVAVAVDGGLITPIVRRTEQKSLIAIAAESRELAGKARDKKLEPHEYSGSSFSISNLGMFGIDHFTAVLNPPAAGILAVGQTKRVPVVDADGELSVGQRMTVTLTCDHRAVDGAVGAVFLQRFARYMETPLLLA